MTGFEKTIVGAGKWAISRGYEKYTLQRLEKALARAGEDGVTVSDLCQNEHRFAQFVRMVRALEICSSNEMLEYLTKVLVAGVKTGQIDREVDTFQIVLANLGQLTQLEVNIIVWMQSKNMYGNVESEHATKQLSKDLEDFCYTKYGFSNDLTQSLMLGLTKSGFVLVEAPSRGRAIEQQSVNNRSSYYLTELARELFSLIHYKHGL